jgi:hypothetical protein
MNLMLSIAAKSLARDPNSDMKLMLYPKPSFEAAVEFLDAKDAVGFVDWSIGQLRLAQSTRSVGFGTLLTRLNC